MNDKITEQQVHDMVWEMSSELVEHFARHYISNFENQWAWEFKHDYGLDEEWEEFVSYDGCTEEQFRLIHERPEWFLESARGRKEWQDVDKEIAIQRITHAMRILRITSEELDLAQMQYMMGV